MKLSKHWLGVVQLVIASVCFGFLGVFGKLAFANGLSIGALLTYRFTLAAVLLWIGCLLFKPNLIRIDLKQFIISALLGLFGYAIFATLYFTAIQGVSIALAALLLYTYPFWVSLISHSILKERMNTLQWACLLVASVGLGLLLWGKLSVSNWLAFLAGLGAALTYAIYILVSAKLQKNIQPLSSSLYVITFAALGLYLFHRPNMSAAFTMNVAQFKSVISIAIICTILPLTLVLAGLQKIKSTEAALLTMIEPVTAATMAWIIFSEKLGHTQAIGAGLVLIALAARTVFTK